VPKSRPICVFHVENAGPPGRAVGGSEFGKPVAVAGAAGEDEFAVGGEFQERAVDEVGAWAVDLEWRGSGVGRGDNGGAGGDAGGEVRRLRRPRSGVALLRIVALLEARTPEVDIAGGPVVAVAGVLADDDPEAGLRPGPR
jgi:hypothetical protein